MPSEPIKTIIEQCKKDSVYFRDQRYIEFADNFDKLIEHAATLTAALKDPPKHKFWGAGEKDCPPEIKARNGELHTLRCKLCESPKHPICLGQIAAIQQQGGEK
jgi:hypothetical protein